MIVYEVIAIPQPELRETYEAYMRDTHVRDVLATGAFLSATMSVSDNGRYRIAYIAAQQTDLDEYLQTHAPSLRADFAAHFPKGIELTREVWAQMEEWSGPKG